MIASCGSSSSIALIEGVRWQPWDDQFTRAKLRIVLVIELVLLIDLLHGGCHPSDASLVYLLLKHVLIVLILHCGTLKVRLLPRGRR